MQPDDVTVEILDRDLQRVGQVLPNYWTDPKFILRLREVGDWTLSLPADSDAAALLAQPSSGILVTGPAGELFSGLTSKGDEKATQTDPGGTITFSGSDFNQLVADALAWPDPGNGDPATQAAAYDVRTGPAETVIRSLIDANIGPSAPASRRGRFASMLQLDIDQQRGSTITSSTRFDPLLDQAATLGRVGGIGFRITVEDDGLLLRFFEPADRSKLIRLDITNGTLDSYEGIVSAPAVTEVIVGGQGDGVARTFLQRSSDAAQTAEALWGRRIEQFKDERNTDDPTELQQAGDEILTDGGSTQYQLKLDPSDDQTMQYQQEWNLGDFITAVTSYGEEAQIVTTVGIALGKSGVLIGAEVGDLDPDDVANLQFQRRLNRLETRT